MNKQKLLLILLNLILQYCWSERLSLKAADWCTKDKHSQPTELHLYSK